MGSAEYTKRHSNNKTIQYRSFLHSYDHHYGGVIKIISTTALEEDGSACRVWFPVIPTNSLGLVKYWPEPSVRWPRRVNYHHERLCSRRGGITFSIKPRIIRIPGHVRKRGRGELMCHCGLKWPDPVTGFLAQCWPSCHLSSSESDM